MRRALALGAVLVLAAAAARSAPEEAMPSPLDYAYGWPIEQQSPSGFHEFDLPIEVYRSVADPGLRDIGVYDARGEPAPRLISAPKEAETPDQVVEKTLLPVLAAPGTPVADMRLALERSDGGTSVRIESMAAADARRRRRRSSLTLRISARRPAACAPSNSTGRARSSP